MRKEKELCCLHHQHCRQDIVFVNRCITSEFPRLRCSVTILLVDSVVGAQFEESSSGRSTPLDTPGLCSAEGACTARKN